MKRLLALALLFLSSVSFAQTTTKGVGIVQQAAIPWSPSCPTGTSCMWVDTTNGQVQLYDTVAAAAKTIPSIITATKGDIAAWTGTTWLKLAAGGDGECLTAQSAEDTGLDWASCGSPVLSTVYANGASAANQTMLIQSGDGGPVIFKGNGASTGALVQAQTSAAAQLFSIADNAQGYISGSAANSGTNAGVVTDAKTALLDATRPYLSVRNGGTEQWSFNTDTGDGDAQVFEATVGTKAKVIGNAELVLQNDAVSASYVDLQTTAATLLCSAGPVTLQGSTVVTAKSTAADGATAIAFTVNSVSTWANAGARLISAVNNATEKFAVLATTGGILAPSMASGTTAMALSNSVAMTGSATAMSITNTVTSTSGDRVLSFVDNVTFAMGIKSLASSIFALEWLDGSLVFGTGGAIQLRPGGTYTVAVTSTGLNPASDMAYNIGATASRWGTIWARHDERGQAAKPTCAVGSGAGGSASCVVTTNSTDAHGVVTVTLGTAPLAASTLVTITFNTAFSIKPFCDLTPKNAVAADNPTMFPFEGTNTTTTLVMTTPTVAYTAGDVAIMWNCDGTTSN